MDASPPLNSCQFRAQSSMGAVHRSAYVLWVDCQVILAFFEKRKTQRWSLIGGKQEERLFWEQW